jgi:hypothetical protein
MLNMLHADQLVEESCRRTGLDRFDAESFRESLGILLSDWNEQEVSQEAAARFREAIVTALSTRLRVHEYLTQRPELLERATSLRLRHPTNRYDTTEQSSGRRSRAALAAIVGNR